MKKKTVSLKKLSLSKSAIASLNGSQQAKALGGANSDYTTPCGPCNYSEYPTCLCISENNNTVCKVTHDCPPTGATYCVVC